MGRVLLCVGGDKYMTREDGAWSISGRIVNSFIPTPTTEHRFHDYLGKNGLWQMGDKYKGVVGVRGVGEGRGG